MVALRQRMKLCLFIIIAVISVIYGRDVCSSFTYCDDGYHCCENNTQCCSDVALAVGGIVGIVVGCIVFISCVIAVVCCIRKRKHSQGHVNQPAQQPGVAMVATTYGQPAYGHPMYGQQPAYGHQPYGVQQPPSGGHVYPPTPLPDY